MRAPLRPAPPRTRTMSPSALEMAQAEMDVVKQRQFQEKVVNEEFKIWKRSVPLLYDTIHTIVADSAACSFQWLPAYTHAASQGPPSVTASFVLAANSALDGSYLKAASLPLPATLAPDFSTVYPGLAGIPVPAASPAPAPSLTTIRKYKQKSPVSCTKISAAGDRLLSLHQSGLVRATRLGDDDAPVVEYKYHKQEGSCLEWIDPAQFLSGAKDWQIALWNAAKPSTPIRLFKSHQGAVNGISAHRSVPAVFASVADDSTTRFHDIRTSPLLAPPIVVPTAHIQNAVALHPDIDTMYVTAGHDNVVNLYDLRHYKTPYRLLFGHNDSVAGLRWDPHHPLRLVSWAADRRVHLWDLANLAADYTYPSPAATDNSRRKASRKAGPCLAFVHAGHTQAVACVDIHPAIPNVYASVGAEGLVEVWKPKTLALDNDSDEDMPDTAQDSKDADEDKRGTAQDSKDADEDKRGTAPTNDTNEDKSDTTPTNDTNEDKSDTAPTNDAATNTNTDTAPPTADNTHRQDLAQPLSSRPDPTMATDSHP